MKLDDILNQYSNVKIIAINLRSQIGASPKVKNILESLGFRHRKMHSTSTIGLHAGDFQKICAVRKMILIKKVIAFNANGEICEITLFDEKKTRELHFRRRNYHKENTSFAIEYYSSKIMPIIR